jgi:hypothetical protein
LNQVVLERNLKSIGVGGSGSFKYVEITDTVTLQPGEQIKKDYSLGAKSMLITTVYLTMTNGGSFQFQIYDSTGFDRFLLYDTAIVRNYTDSVFLPYKDHDNVTTNTMHTQITSMTSTAEKLNIKIIGLELEV